MRRRWESKSGNQDVEKLFKRTETTEGDDDESDGSLDGEDEDIDMDEAPPLVRVREPAMAEVDDDGFTKVTKKKR
ncbi:pre-rRNA-processing protein TSR2 [Diplocarpon rosae]|nr:pre-rRNA-processing protein TSR2 [Diplocarpon rosae]